MSTPIWLPDFLLRESRHLSQAATYLEMNRAPDECKGMVVKAISRWRTLAETLEKAVESGAEAEMQKAWELFLVGPADLSVPGGAVRAS